MQPDSRRMKKFGLYSCTCHAGISMHFGPPVIHVFGSAPGSMNALGGWAGMAGADGAGVCAAADAASTKHSQIPMRQFTTILLLAGLVRARHGRGGWKGVPLRHRHVPSGERHRLERPL